MEWEEKEPIDYGFPQNETQKIDKIIIVSFITEMPDINFKISENVNLRMLKKEEKDEIMNTMHAYCAAMKLPEAFLEEFQQSTAPKENSRSSICALEYTIQDIDFQSSDIASLIKRTIQNEIQDIVAALGLISNCVPEYHGAIIIAVYLGQGIAISVLPTNQGHNHSKFTTENIKQTLKIQRKMSNDPIFRMALKMFLSSLEESDRELALIKNWAILEILSNYFLRDKTPKNKKERVIKMLHTIKLNDGKYLAEKVNSNLISHIYSIRNDLIHSGVISENNKKRYISFSKYSFKDLSDYSGHLCKIGIFIAAGFNVNEEGDFLNRINSLY